MLAISSFLLLLSAVSFYLIWYLMWENGTAQLLRDIRDDGPHYLPGTTEPLKQFYTGISLVDYQLTVLNTFFYSAIDGSNPSASLQIFDFSGQFGAAWGLILLEGLGQPWLISDIGLILWGAGAQNISYTVTMPMYYVANLWLRRPASSNASGVPCAIIIGYIVPAILMCLPLDSQTRQTWMSVWQAFPLWLTVLYRLIPPHLEVRTAKRVSYAFLLLLSAVTSIASRTVMIVATILPHLIASKYRDAYGPGKVFVPVSASPEPKMKSIGDGFHLLLQWDEIVGSASLLTWALYLFSQRKSFGSTWQYGGLIFAVLLGSAIVGPSGCAVALFWLRDELTSSTGS